MTCRKPDPGLDGLDPLELFIRCQMAARAYQTALPPQGPLIDEARLWKLKQGLAAGKCGGVREEMGC